MEGLRTSYFMNWLLPKWGADPKRLESVSVCEIVEEYIAEMLKSSSSPQNAIAVAPPTQDSNEETK
jgi:hypothetical protein